MTAPNCAEQGTDKVSSNERINFSRFVSRMRVVTVAMVSQPRPSTIGRTARHVPDVKKPDLGPAGKIVDQAGDLVEGLTKKPPPTVPPLPSVPAPKVPAPPDLGTGKQDSDKDLLDYLLGN